MDWNVIQKHWPRFTTPLRQAFPGLTEARLSEIDGDRDALIAELERCEALPAMEAEQRLTDWMQGPLPADVYSALDTQAVTDSKRYIAPGEDTLSDDAAFGAEVQPQTPIGRRD